MVALVILLATAVGRGWFREPSALRRGWPPSRLWGKVCWREGWLMPVS